MILAEVQMMLIEQEGCKLFPYICSEGKLTIGVGRNLEDVGISNKEALFLLTEDIQKCYKDLSFYFFPAQFESFSEQIQNVLISMRFNLGHKGFKGFKKMIFAFREGDYQEAIRQMKDSRWYNQVPGRANQLIKMVESSMLGEESRQ